MGSLSDYEWAAKVNECITSRVVGELPMAPADLNARALAECRASDQTRIHWCLSSGRSGSTGLTSASCGVHSGGPLTCGVSA